MRTFLIVFLLWYLFVGCGCTSHAVMTDDRGVPVDCRYTAIGPFSALVGSEQQDRCIERYQALGFRRASSLSSPGLSAEIGAAGRAAR